MKPVGIERNSFQEWDSWHPGAGWGRRHLGHVGREGPLPSHATSSSIALSLRVGIMMT